MGFKNLSFYKTQAAITELRARKISATFKPACAKSPVGVGGGYLGGNIGT